MCISFINVKIGNKNNIMLFSIFVVTYFFHNLIFQVLAFIFTLT